MRSAELSLDRYDSDKVENRYFEYYDPMLEPWLDREITMLELGVRRGGSLLLWRDYFPRATIVGIDIALPKDFKPTERIQLYEGSQADTQFLTRVARETAPGGYDIIIDDASHVGSLTKVGFWHLFDNHLKPGGLFVIEDWGTGYWDDWPDGQRIDLDSYLRQPEYPIPLWKRALVRFTKRVPKAQMPCHAHGMVGFVKQLVDEQAAADVTRGLLQARRGRASRFESMTITPSIVFVKKAR